MKLWEKLTAKDVERFAKELADEVAKRYPVEMANDKQKKVSEKRLTKILERIYGKAVEYKQRNGLGFYRKAKLGNSFRWALDEIGYSKEFIEVATQGMIVYISRKS